MPPRPNSRSMEYSPASAVWTLKKSSSRASARAAVPPVPRGADGEDGTGGRTLMALSYGRESRFTTMIPPQDPSTYFRKGFGLKAEVQDELAGDYDGRLVDLLKSQDYTLSVGEVTIRLAREFGFCYGVERAVEYAYQTRRKFPDRRIFLVGEIIHNPHVNAKLRDMGIAILLHVQVEQRPMRIDFYTISSKCW